MGLEEIFKSIDEKVKREVDSIKREAEEQKKKILEEAEKKAEERKKQIIKDSKKQAEEQMRKELIKVRREEKKKILTFKSEVMEEVFREAQNRFLNLKKEEYLSSIKQNLISNIKRGDEEIIMSPRDKELIDVNFLDEIKKAVIAKGQKPKLKFIFELNKEERGFIIKSKNVQVNATVSTLFSTIKDKEEIEVARLLFS